MTAEQWKIKSNIKAHGVRWAFDHELTNNIKSGWSFNTAFAFACNAVFHRHIGA